MPYCPSRSPANLSKGFPGGRRKSSKPSAASKTAGFRRTARCKSTGKRRENRRLNSPSVSLSRKLLIMHHRNNALRYYCQALLSLPPELRPTLRSGGGPRRGPSSAIDGKTFRFGPFCLSGGKNGPFWPKKFPASQNGPKTAVLGPKFGHYYQVIMYAVLDQNRPTAGVCRRADVGRLPEIIEESTIDKKFSPRIFPPLTGGGAEKTLGVASYCPFGPASPGRRGLSAPRRQPMKR